MRKEDRLLALYNRLPKLECKGLCWESCGPIPVYQVESARIVRIHQKRVKTNMEDATCLLLTEDHRCSVYPDRPLICRLYGMVERMKCPHGCVPEGGLLTEEEGFKFMKELARIDGSNATLDLDG